MFFSSGKIRFLHILHFLIKIGLFWQLCKNLKTCADFAVVINFVMKFCEIRHFGIFSLFFNFFFGFSPILSSDFLRFFPRPFRQFFRIFFWFVSDFFGLFLYFLQIVSHCLRIFFSGFSQIFSPIFSLLFGFLTSILQF